jgi:hypothetical protein
VRKQKGGKASYPKEKREREERERERKRRMTREKKTKREKNAIDHHLHTTIKHQA